jgi:hypothetical protein
VSRRNLNLCASSLRYAVSCSFLCANYGTIAFAFAYLELDVSGLGTLNMQRITALRKLTVRLSGREPKTPPRPKISAPVMADQEEDFSGLPINERFTHKVVHSSVNFWASPEWKLDLESAESCIRGRREVIRDHPRRA